ncbi:translation initiation factor 2 [Aspergillus undulatus]|uniref:translation initiation factor 2 n=1 Tax=Aspergillus undulatus TaxID=1810928 RepID=UPI003CCE2424
MHRRTIVQLSRRHAVEWPGTARLRDATVARPSQRSFHPSLYRLNSSDPPSSNNSDAPATAPRVTPKFGARWGSRQTQQAVASVLSPEEQAIRNALLSKSASEQKQQQQKQQQRQETSQGSRAQQWSRTSRQTQEPQPSQQSHHLHRSRTPWGSKRYEGQSLSASHVGPGQAQRSRGSPLDRESRNLQPERQYEVNGPGKIPPHLRKEDWVCPDCGFSCFGKHSICPRCRARRPRLRRPTVRNPFQSLEENPVATSPETRNQDWTCLGCGMVCVGKYGFCPQCGTRRLESAASASDAAPNEPPTEPRRNTVRDLRLNDSAESTGDSIGDAVSIRKITPIRDEWVVDRSSARKSALWKHMAARAAADEEEEAGFEGLRRRMRPPKQDIEPWSRDSDRFRERDERDKKSKRRGREERDSGGGEEDFDIDEYYRRREERKKQKKQRARVKEEKEVAEPEARPLYLPEFISVSNFADVVGMRPGQLVQQMEEMGFEDVSYSHVLDAETSSLIAAEFGYDPIVDTGAEQDLMAAPIPEDTSIWPSRPPVVTIMGHVDHGKTTILDWLREASVAASEHGGITQHIGAFSVPMPSGKKITFLDTPGHAAFLDMRRRGADVTDIVVLVVAADDSVKPQTVEAIKHATSAKVPIIVAISKIDKEGIDPERVKQDLSIHGIHVEDYGGDVQAIGVSGKTGQGMLELEEAIVTLSEVLDYRADANGVVEGWVIEGTTKSYGRVATVLVRRGTLRPGDILVAGKTWTRVRTLRNEAGISVSAATPGTPVEIDGWKDQPAAGTEMLQAGDEQHAKEVVEYRLEREETEKLGEDTTAINEARRDLLAKRAREAAVEEGAEWAEEETSSGPKPVNFVLKADVDGSAEAVLNSVTAIGNNEVYARVLRSEVGPISESDIELAAAAKGHIISFNTPIDAPMSRMAEFMGVRIMDHNIIYKLVDDVKDTLSEQLAPTITQRVTGEAEIGQIFEISLKGREKTYIAGCKVRNGLINRTKKVRVLRGQETIYDGSISSLKNVKKDVTEMRKDTECGIAFESWTDFAVGDQIQCYEEVSEKRHL